MSICSEKSWWVYLEFLCELSDAHLSRLSSKAKTYVVFGLVEVKLGHIVDGESVEDINGKLSVDDLIDGENLTPCRETEACANGVRCSEAL
ncbi:unnamed protein product [Linum trigynum]|uniref:Uncharacterized protein n=1 Tax=Linum trigynum TaxID=586398 RepID=A0AAV2CG76_9ROSI